MRFINLTPHPITLVTEEGKIEIPPSGEVLRVAEERKVLEKEELVEEVLYKDITIGEKAFRNEHELYEYLKEKFNVNENGRVYVIVSLPALLSLKAKGFAREYQNYLMVAPDTSRRAVRDEQGRIVGVKGFVTL